MLHLVQIYLHMVVLSLPIFLFFFFMAAISAEFDLLLLFSDAVVCVQEPASQA
jgi:hypothetical protein